MKEIKQCFDFDCSFIEPNCDLRNCFVEKNKTTTSFCELSKENNKHLTLSILSVLLFQYNQSLIKEKNNLQNRIDKALNFIDCHFKEMVADEEAQELKSILKESGE